MMIGLVQPGTRRGTFLQMIGSRKITPPKMLRKVSQQPLDGGDAGPPGSADRIPGRCPAKMADACVFGSVPNQERGAARLQDRRALQPASRPGASRRDSLDGGQDLLTPERRLVSLEQDRCHDPI